MLGKKDKSLRNIYAHGFKLYTLGQHMARVILPMAKEVLQ
jgi:hypothetical protein